MLPISAVDTAIIAQRDILAIIATARLIADHDRRFSPEARLYAGEIADRLDKRV